MARKPRTAVLEPEQPTATDDTLPTADPAEVSAAQPIPAADASAAPDADNGDVMVHPVAGLDGQADDIRGFARIDPRRLVIGANVRTKAEIAELVPDVRERGVRVPIEVYRDENQQYVIVAGQRRTLAAIEAGRAYVPIMIVERPEQAALVVEQVHENQNRHGLTVEDQVHAYEQLAAFGLSAAQIAKKLHTDKKTIEAGLKVARSGNTRAAVAADPELDVKQGAVIAELAEDDDALRERLTRAAHAGTLDHEAQKVRDSRLRSAYKEQLPTQLQEQKAIILDWLAEGTAAVGELRDRHGNPLDPASHDKCPGHAVYLSETGDLTEPWVAKAACREYASYGHYRRGDRLRSADLSPEQRMRDKAARKNLIASNKAWESAQTVRRTWLSDYLTRKSLPNTATRFLLESYALAGDQLTKSMNDGHPLGAQLLGITESAFLPGKTRTALTEMLGKATDARAQVIVLGLVLGAYEDATGKHSWRAVNSYTARYLRFLADQGYRLSDVERLAAALPLDADQAVTDEADEPADDDFDE